MRLPKIIYKIFVDIIHKLVIVPRQDEIANNYWWYYGKAIFCIIAITADSIWEYFVKILNHEDKFSGRVKFGWSLMLAFTYACNLSVYMTFLKRQSWKSLYRTLHEVRILGENAIINYDSRMAKIVIVIFFTINLVYSCNEIYNQGSSIFMNRRDLIQQIILPASQWLHFYYKVAVIALLEIVLIHIHANLREARTIIKLNVRNIKQSKYIFIRMHKASIIICNLFGTQLLLIFAHWFLYLLTIYFCIFEVVRYSGGKAAWQIVINLSISLFISAVGPCAITFTCDMVTAEAYKLMSTCYELQRTLNYRSQEYRDLDSFATFIVSTGIRFTAADFFEITRSTLLSVIAISTTYFVALVQFY